MALGERVEETKGKKRGRYEWRSKKKIMKRKKGIKERKRERTLVEKK